MATPSSNSVPTYSYAAPASTTIAALTYGEAWGTAVGSGMTLTYSFPTSGSNFVAGYGLYSDASNFQAAGAALQTAIEAALQDWANVADIALTESTDSSSTVGELRFSLSTNTAAGTTGYAYMPSATPEAGDVWLNSLYFSGSPTLDQGSSLYKTLLHEIGHALGLKHPFEGATTLSEAEDTYAYTVMSYDAVSGATGVTASIYPTTPMVYDIAAIQYLYGANWDYNSGDTVYTYSGDSSYWETIWDGGGEDTLVYASSTGGEIDLREGQYSQLGDPITFSNGATDANTVAIAFDCEIENAVGGGGDDSIIGNDLDNALKGAGGDDTIDGGAGFDTVYLSGSYFAYYVELSQGAGIVVDQAGGDGHDVLSNIELVLFTDGSRAYLDDGDSIAGTGGYDWVELGHGGGAFAVAAVDVVVGGTGTDVLTLASSSNSVVVVALESLTGGTGGDWITLGNRGNTTVVVAVETVYGGTGNDDIRLANGGATAVVTALDTLTGGTGTDVITLSNRGETLVAGAIEWLSGGTGSDWITLAHSGNTSSLAAIDILLGGTGTDVITLTAAADSIIVAALESISGGGGDDWVTLGNRGNTVTLAGVETVLGGTGNDVVQLSGLDNQVLLAAVETLTGTPGSDGLRLGNRGNTMTIGGVETITGGLGLDLVTLADSGSSIAVAALETLSGTGGADVISIAGAGITMTVSAVETVAGSAGADWIWLSGSGSTVALAQVEVLAGSTGSDAVVLTGAGSTITLAALETLTGSTGVDVVQLGNRGNTLSAIGCETLLGGLNADLVSVTGGAVWFQGGGGADGLALQPGSNDTVAFAAADDGSPSGVASGADTVTGFSTGDGVVITGSLRDAVDANDNGSLGSGELVVLSQTVADLTNFSAVASGLGSVTAAAGTSFLAVANDGTRSALYLVTSDGNAVVSTDEIRLLATFTGGILLASSHFSLA